MNNVQRSSSTEQKEVIRIAVVAGRWHKQIVSGLLAAATTALREEGCYFEVFHAPTTFDTPVIIQALLEGTWDGAVALGAVIPGKSSRFEHLSRAVSNRLSELTLQTRKPVGFGMLMVHDEDQGLDRAGLPGSKESKGREAALSTVETVRLLRDIRSSTSAQTGQVR